MKTTVKKVKKKKRQSSLAGLKRQRKNPIIADTGPLFDEDETKISDEEAEELNWIPSYKSKASDEEW